jgi:hypothetical protein
MFMYTICATLYFADANKIKYLVMPKFYNRNKKLSDIVKIAYIFTNKQNHSGRL